MKRRGSALVMALWLILILSVIVMSFSYEARSQVGINIYVREKNRVRRLIDAGRILGEAVLLNYQDVKDWQPDEDVEELMKEDRWYREKRDLKGGEGTRGGQSVIGPILLDEDNPDSGTVTVEISAANHEAQGLNINEFYSEEQIQRWQLILDLIGIYEDEGRRNFRTKDGESINLSHHIIGGWIDYRDDNDVRTSIKGEECGAEKDDYDEFYDEHEDDYAETDRFGPANGPISDLHELARVKVFQEYPAILTGGVVNPWEDEESQITVLNGGLMGVGIFGVSGGIKINVNHCTLNQLLTVPGVYDEEEYGTDDQFESKAAAQAILDCLKIRPRESEDEEGREIYPYKDFNDMCARIEDEFPDVEIDPKAAEFLMFKPAEDMLFTMKITASSMGMKYIVECDCYVDSDKKIRYVRWKE